MAEIYVRYMDPDQIKRIAFDFLQKHHPRDDYPVPIEEILEFKLGIDIIPIPSLHDIIETDGFISSDLSSISVDEYVYKHRQGRYRFTLAHEIGHAVMHENAYKRHHFDSLTDWRDFMESFPEKQWSWLEWQANYFASLVLIPEHHLEKRIIYHTKQLKALGILTEVVIADRLADMLAKDFIVSKDAIQIRIKVDSNRTHGNCVPGITRNKTGNT